MSYCSNCGDEVKDISEFCLNCGTLNCGFSARETDVLQLLSEGRTNREIANVLYISEQTVKTHLAHVFDKLGTSDRTATVATVLRKGLVT